MTGGLLNIPNLILAGDLNLTLNAAEIWGKKSSIDPLGPHFKHRFSFVDLVDIAPPYASPPWRNGRTGDEGISKMLDGFMLSSYLIRTLHGHRV